MSTNSTLSSTDTWQNIRLPIEILDISYDFQTDGGSFKDLILERNIPIDINNEKTIDEIKKRNCKEEFRILEQVIDYNEIFEDRLYDQKRSNKNRYIDILPCIQYNYLIN